MDRVESLFEEIERARRERRLPPVEKWQPAHVGSIDIRMARDGTWFHEGRPILRQPLVDLFATVLRREGDAYFLVTPGEKLRIQVEDVPFLGVRLTRDGAGPTQRLRLSTNVGDHVAIDAGHPIVMREHDGQAAPYVMVRAGLEARLVRSVYYELVELGEEAAGTWIVHSEGIAHPLGAVVAE
jgi:hypothetical protein